MNGKKINCYFCDSPATEYPEDARSRSRIVECTGTDCGAYVLASGAKKFYVDPGNMTDDEKKLVSAFIKSNNKPAPVTLENMKILLRR